MSGTVGKSSGNGGRAELSMLGGVERCSPASSFYGGVVMISFLVHFTCNMATSSSINMHGRIPRTPTVTSVREEGGSNRVSTPHYAPFRGPPSKSQDPSWDAFELPGKTTRQSTHCSVLSTVVLKASPGPFSSRDTRCVPALRGSRRRLCDQLTIFCQRREENRISWASEEY